MKRRLGTLLVLPLAACAAAGPTVNSMEALRKDLDLLAASGHVERAGGHAWLVDDEAHARLVRLPDGPVACRARGQETPSWRLYAGDPAAALAFDAETVTLWWRDEAHGCAMAAPVFDQGLPEKPTLVAATQWRSRALAEPPPEDEESAPAEAAGDAAADGSEPAVESDREGLLAAKDEVLMTIAGQPGEVTVRLTPSGVEVVARDEVVLFSDGAREPERRAACGSAYESSVHRGTAADGATLLHFEWSAAHTDAWQDGDTPSCDMTDLAAATERHEAWVVFPKAGGDGRVIYRSNVSKTLSEGEELDVAKTIDLPGGTLEYSGYGSTAPDAFRNGRTTFTYSWTYAPADGPSVVLVSATY